jgi:hypothetical protein
VLIVGLRPVGGDVQRSSANQTFCTSDREFTGWVAPCQNPNGPTSSALISALGVDANPWHGVGMKRVVWLRKMCFGSCAKAKEQAQLNGVTIGSPVIGAEAFSSRATIAEATVASATAAVALAVLAIGGMAVGFLVVGRLIIREMLVQKVHLRRLKIDQLELEELRVSKLTILEGKPPDGTAQK